MGIMKLGRETFTGISARLITSFSLIITVTVFIFGWVYLYGLPFTSYEGRIENQKKKIFDGLSQIADNKKVNLLSFIDDRRSDTLVTASNASIVSGAVHILHTIHELIEAGIDEPALWSLLTRDNNYLDIVGQLRTIRDIYGYYDNIQIADRETGIVFISTDNSTLGTDLSRELFFMNALLPRNVYVCDIKAQPEDRQPAMHFNYLLTDSQGGAAAVLMMKVDAEVIIKSIFQARPLLGDTGEVLLVNQDRQILTQLKYPLADGTAAKPLQYTITALPATLASRGEEGIIETTDYRGEKVLSAYRHISLSADCGWGMVIKTDYEELFALIRVEIVNSLTIGIVSIVILMVFAILVIRRITGPIISLKEIAERITGGDFGVRAKISSSDEVGVLARAFNQMADSLVDANTGLEEEVRERTKDLESELIERKRAEDEIRLERDNFFNILAAMEDGVYIVNKEFDIQYVNPVLQKEFGLFENRKCYEYFHSRKEVCPWCKNDDVFAGKTVQWEWSSEKNGKTYDLIDTPLKNPDGSISKLEIFRDITDRKQTEKELEKHRKHLEELVKERTAELEEKNAELEHYNSLFEDREFRIKELRDKLKEYESR